MERRMTPLAGVRPLALLGLPADFFVPPPDPAAPEKLRLEWPRRGKGPRFHGDAGLQAAFRQALAEYEAAELAAARARVSGDLRGFFQNMTETHRCYAALEAFDLPPADLARLQKQCRRRAARALR
ncbi:hypothetical protein JYK14_18685 [Siccirubricoccus sp. KC 17139]|uniref:Uncharacterized protein n=1 Tax=Siccirubricoccus soli TaxID=2899147 RepID=A0ABT1D8I0_9PROT|nr:hypothetical protein [Siccirubricoccus soli]MCO6418174.1 hypothetical protein [Siccirubricoccus soli]MCP2684309.1 hypothetical protein [Siccirubricoccus soli]